MKYKKRYVLCKGSPVLSQGGLPVVDSRETVGSGGGYSTAKVYFQSYVDAPEYQLVLERIDRRAK